MLRRILQKSFTILGGAFLCIAVLSLVSCENFLKGADVRSQLEEAIEIANTNPVTVYVTAQEGTGTVTPAQLRLKKKETFDILFKPSNNYMLEEWTVRNRLTGEPVTDAISFEDVNALETKGTLLNPIENLEIMAKCYLQPAVINISPTKGTQNQVNTPIIISFNTTMDESILEKGKISVTCFGSDILEEYFDLPELNESKDTVIIKPKTSTFLSFINSQKKGFIDVNVKLSNTITVEKDGKSVPLKQDSNTDFFIRYIIIQDDNPPEYTDFFLSRDCVNPGLDIYTANRFHENIKLIDETYDYETFIEEQSEESLDNLCGEYVYIYGKFRDKESAIERVSVYEQFCGDSDNKTIREKILAKKYILNEDENIVYYIDKDNYTYFRIKHYLSSKDGAVKISACVSDIYDVDENSVKHKTYTSEILAFKLTNIVFSSPGAFSIYNWLGDSYSETQINSTIKEIEFECILGYDEIFIPYTWVLIPEDFYSIKCEYLHSNGEISSDILDDCGVFYWKKRLDIEKLSGSKLKFIISDKLGNVVERQYNLPKSQDYIGVQTPDSEDNTKAKIQFYFKNGEYACAPSYIIKDSQNNYTVINNDYDKLTVDMISGNTYKFVPNVGFEFDGIPTVRFLLEMPDYTYTVSSQNGNQNQSDIETANYAGTDKPYTISRNFRKELLDVTVKISDDSWEKGFDEIVLCSKDKAFTVGQYSENESRFLWSIAGAEYVAYKINEYESTITLLTEPMFKSPTDLFVYGIKNGVCCSEAKITIPQFTAELTDYDNYNRWNYDIGFVTLNCDTAIISLRDEQTGVDKNRSFVVEGSDIYNLYGLNVNTSTLSNLGRSVYKATVPVDNIKSGTIEFPRWMYTDTGFSFYFCDNGGNIQMKSVRAAEDSLVNWIPTLITIEEEEKTAKTQIGVALPLWVVAEKVMVYKWDKENNASENEKPKWIFFKENACDVYWKMEKSELQQDFPADKFIKVVAKYPDDKSTLYQRFTAPAYIYTGTPNSGNKDYVYPAFNGIIAVSSDAPVLARTVVTSVDYEECKNWSVSKWENGRKFIREEVLNCNGSANEYYKIYDDAKDLKGAKCYAVIIHFANGTTTMTPIMQK